MAREPQWRVRAWVTAPGDFPSEMLKTVNVNAPDAKKAIAKSEKTEAFITSPVIVSVERVYPPAERHP